MALDSRVHLIVTLRRRGCADDDITAMTSLYDAVSKPMQVTLAKIITLENPEIVKTLVSIAPDVFSALARPNNGPAADKIVEEAAAKFASA